jgi:hypothetical protein
MEAAQEVRAGIGPEIIETKGGHGRVVVERARGRETRDDRI